MIIKNKISFGDGKALYELIGSTYDSFPFKRNHTLPDDAVNGSTLDVNDINKTFIYFSVEENGETYETWLWKGASSDNAQIVAYKSNNDTLVINNPADVAAVQTAIATAFTVKKITCDGNNSEVSYGTTVGTNYQIVVPNSVIAGDYTALIILHKTTPATGRAKVDSFNCPTLSIGESRLFGGSGIAAPKSFTSVFGYGSAVTSSVPYKITNNREENLEKA